MLALSAAWPVLLMAFLCPPRQILEFMCATQVIGHANRSGTLGFETPRELTGLPSNSQDFFLGENPVKRGGNPVALAK